jgi:hypothetical protein
MTDPPENRARRAATGIARSARSDPSRGTKIRLNNVLLPSVCSPYFHTVAMFIASRKPSTTFDSKHFTTRGKSYPQRI